MFSARPPRNRQTGMALIEVLIAFLILSIALIGFSSLQVRAAKAAQSSLQRTDAAILAGSMLDAIRANRDANKWAPGGKQYNISNQCSVPASGATLASNDLHSWFDSLQKSLGSSACATITCSMSYYCTVDISWDDSRALGGAATQKFQLVGAI